MPDFPIIDTHIHFWDPANITMDWMPEDSDLSRPYYPEDLFEAAGEVEIEGLVFVEADVHQGDFLREAEWVTELAANEPRIKAICASAPLHLGASADDDLAALATLPLVKSVRRLLQNEDDPAFCLREEFLDGVRLLPKYGLHFEICIFHTQLEPAIQMVEQCPEVNFNLNHIGKPGIKDGLRDVWWQEIADLADLPNVNCKLSGVATEADFEQWTPDELLPFMQRTVDAFGPNRVMFGGDWPVSTLAIDYPGWVDLVDEAIADLSEDEQQAIYRDNARMFYGF